MAFSSVKMLVSTYREDLFFFSLFFFFFFCMVCFYPFQTWIRSWRLYVFFSQYFPFQNIWFFSLFFFLNIHFIYGLNTEPKCGFFSTGCRFFYKESFHIFIPVPSPKVLFQLLSCITNTFLWNKSPSSLIRFGDFLCLVLPTVHPPGIH